MWRKSVTTLHYFDHFFDASKGQQHHELQVYAGLLKRQLQLQPAFLLQALNLSMHCLSQANFIRASQHFRRAEYHDDDGVEQARAPILGQTFLCLVQDQERCCTIMMRIADLVCSKD